MSCDFAIWQTASELSNEEAVRLYNELCEGKTSGVVASPAIEALYAELTELHPEIHDIPESEIDNPDLCPWSIAFDRSPGHLIICSIWSEAEYVAGLLANLSEKHGLALFNPQTSVVIYPRPSNRPWWRFWD